MEVYYVIALDAGEYTYLQQGIILFFLREASEFNLFDRVYLSILEPSRFQDTGISALS